MTRSIEQVMSMVDQVTNDLSANNYSELFLMNLVALANDLQTLGPQVEAIYNDQLNRAFIALRKSSYSKNLQILPRKLILFLIEIRAHNWVVTDTVARYYRSELHGPMLNAATQEQYLLPQEVVASSPVPSLPSPLPAAPPMLAPGETINTSGKFAKPTKIPGKNYYKDEVVIRNADSGKVNPGAKERLVQITGQDEAHINYARQLMGDTIRRNASPVPFRGDQPDLERVGGSSSSVNSSASDESARPQGYQRVRLHHSLSTNDASVDQALPHFPMQLAAEHQEVVSRANPSAAADTAPSRRRVYSRQLLCQCAHAGICAWEPDNWDKICPATLRKVFVSPSDARVPLVNLMGRDHSTALVHSTMLSPNDDSDGNEVQIIYEKLKPRSNLSQGLRTASYMRSVSFDLSVKEMIDEPDDGVQFLCEKPKIRSVVVVPEKVENPKLKSVIIVPKPKHRVDLFPTLPKHEGIQATSLPMTSPGLPDNELVLLGMTGYHGSDHGSSPGITSPFSLGKYSATSSPELSQTYALHFELNKSMSPAMSGRSSAYFSQTPSPEFMNMDHIKQQSTIPFRPPLTRKTSLVAQQVENSPISSMPKTVAALPMSPNTIAAIPLPPSPVESVFVSAGIPNLSLPNARHLDIRLPRPTSLEFTQLSKVVGGNTVDLSPMSPAFLPNSPNLSQAKAFNSSASMIAQASAPSNWFMPPLTPTVIQELPGSKMNRSDTIPSLTDMVASFSVLDDPPVQPTSTVINNLPDQLDVTDDDLPMSVEEALATPWLSSSFVRPESEQSFSSEAEPEPPTSTPVPMPVPTPAPIVTTRSFRPKITNPRLQNLFTNNDKK